VLVQVKETITVKLRLNISYNLYKTVIMAITHSMVNGKADGADATIVRPSDWNANHTITPDTIANILSDHDKAAHDALNIDADTLDGNDSAAFALAAQGVTNGNTHDHSGGDGNQINHTTLSNIGANTHAQVDTHIAATAAHGVVSVAGITIGNYVGDDTENRAIAHGLGAVPKWVKIVKVDGSWAFDLPKSDKLHYYNDGSAGTDTVTAWDAVDFHVGNNPASDAGANSVGHSYYWIAFT